MLSPAAQQRFEELERRGYVVVEALRPEGRDSQTASHPHTYVAIDGRTYWVKGTVQQGLAAELVAARLGEGLGATPPARVIHISDELAPLSAGSPVPADHRDLVFGSEDLRDTVNARDLGQLAPDLRLPSGGIDPRARGRIIAFQTWLGVSDSQVLVRMTDGQLFSIDHGDAFGSLDLSDPVVIVTDIPGVPSTVGKRAGDVMPAVAQIAAVGERELVAAVAQIPAGAAWRSAVARRLEIAEFLAHRRDRLEEVIRDWLRT